MNSLTCYISSHEMSYLRHGLAFSMSLCTCNILFQNGSICFEEFVCGLAIVLHGSFKERCGLLFSVFNLGNDEGISREELRTMLTAIYQSTNTILYTVGDTDRAVLGSEDMQDSITAMVDVAFANCDITRTGKLLPLVSHVGILRSKRGQYWRHWVLGTGHVYTYSVTSLFPILI